MTKLNKNGGIVSDNFSELRKAKYADLVTLPKNVEGTNCFNCRFIEDVENEIGYCSNKHVQQDVTQRMCCALWDAPGIIREFGSEDIRYK